MVSSWPSASGRVRPVGANDRHRVDGCDGHCPRGSQESAVLESTVDHPDTSAPVAQPGRNEDERREHMYREHCWPGAQRNREVVERTEQRHGDEGQQAPLSRSDARGTTRTSQPGMARTDMNHSPGPPHGGAKLFCGFLHTIQDARGEARCSHRADRRAENGGFEPPRVLPQHAFQACAIGH